MYLRMAPEQVFYTFYPLGTAGVALYRLLAVQVFRPDRLTAMMNIFVSSVMGETFLQYCEQELNLATIVEEEITSKTPVILASVVGFDASGRVDDLAAQLSRQCTAVAMGELLCVPTYISKHK